MGDALFKAQQNAYKMGFKSVLNWVKKYHNDYDALDTELEAGNVTATAFMKFQSFTTAAVQDQRIRHKIKDALSDNISTGKGSREFKKTIDNVFDKSGLTKLSTNQINTIYETNTSLAYSAGQMDSMVGVSEDFPYWKYSATLDGKTRQSHRELHGKIFRNGDFTLYPPIGFRCRCSAIPLTARQASKYLKSEMPSTSYRKELINSLENTEFLGNKQKRYIDWLGETYKTADTQTREYIDTATKIMREEIAELKDIDNKEQVEQKIEVDELITQLNEIDNKLSDSTKKTNKKRTIIKNNKVQS